MEIIDRATLQQQIANTPDSYLRPLLAALYLEGLEYQTAIDLCREDLNIHPFSTIGHFIWALTALAMNDPNQAATHLREIIQIDGKFLQAYYKLTELGEDYLTQAELKYCYEKIRDLNPYDDESATQLAAFPVELKSQKPQLQAELEQTDQIEESIEQAIPAEPAESAPEVDPITGAIRLSQFFESIKKSTESPKSPEIQPSPIPEEEAHFGPIEKTEIESEPTVETEPTISFDEPIAEEPQAEELSGSSSVSDLFNRLREKPFEEVQKEDWMQEHLASQTPSPESPIIAESEKPAVEHQVAPQAEKETKATNIPAESEAMVTPKVPSTKAGKASPKTKSASNKQRPPRQSKKSTAAPGNISFPIPTWTLVDILMKQKLYEQALSILDIIESKSKSEKDQAKIQASRAKIVQLMAEEQAGEA
ncbi:MAG TPA: hypothetical protein P5067_08210 [Candidatus Marinimicrobia bacterium]|nr:hypothetical protein [Candidatus Neomarinimicrobiota bacterium]HRS52395.1 hypothetical protein [Candidatus Neomarinimicrobiota bacterium]